ncbi:metal-dependent transcriptional regulator [Candidatus Aerophobetes bacterium]|nr:metal-dependent transcriptional regulator [Candidatus Aerophobetes bacterium]
MTKKITPSMEAYLETIKKIEREKKIVRVKGIARRLNVKMPSVTEALQNLSNEGLIKHEKYGYVELTHQGNELAEEMNLRHQALFSFFTEVLGIEPERADDDACKIEHVISEATMKRLVKFVRFIKDCIGQEGDLLEDFKGYLEGKKGLSRK